MKLKNTTMKKQILNFGLIIAMALTAVSCGGSTETPAAEVKTEEGAKCEAGKCEAGKCGGADSTETKCEAGAEDEHNHEAGEAAH